MKVEMEELSDGVVYLRFDRGPSPEELWEEIEQKGLWPAPCEPKRYPEGIIIFDWRTDNIFAGEDCRWYAVPMMVGKDHETKEVTFEELERVGPCCFAFMYE